MSFPKQGAKHGLTKSRSSPAGLPGVDESQEVGGDRRKSAADKPQRVSTTMKLPSMSGSQDTFSMTAPSFDESQHQKVMGSRDFLPSLSSDAPHSSKMNFSRTMSSLSGTPSLEISLFGLPRRSYASPTLDHRDERTSPFTRKRMVSSCGRPHTRESLMWLASKMAKPDPAYLQVVEEHTICAHGPGPVEQWPLLHDDLYVCRLGDMIRAETLRDAYEVGCHARKREQTTLQLIKQLKADIIPTGHKNVGFGPEKDKNYMGEKKRISLVSCDACGEELAGHDDCGITPGTFYYCRVCKGHGNRYELCETCHAVECAQGVGKHMGSEPHPHFMKCQHNSIVRQKLLHYQPPSTPTSPETVEKDISDFRRVFCDYCGQLAGNCDEKDDIFLCPKCPGDRGVRFELCLPCKQDLDRRNDPMPSGMWSAMDSLGTLGDSCFM